MDALLLPKSIAVVGASDRTEHSRLAFRNLEAIGFAGDIYPVNPKRTDVFGLKCYPQLTDVPETPDLVLALVGRQVLPTVLQACREVGARAMIANADGYAESAEPTGHAAQDEVRELALNSGITLCGPNCLGLLSVPARAAPFCGPIDVPVLDGGLAVLSQSGGNSCELIRGAYERQIGLSYVVSTGNEVVTTLCDYLDYLVEDDAVRGFCLFIESIREPERFLACAERAAAADKPIVAVKIGRSEEGRASALAHTGSLAGSDEVVDALFERGAVIRADDLDDVLDKSLLFSHLPSRTWPRGRRLAVFSIGGGAAGIVADLASQLELDLPELPADVQAAMEAGAPPSVTVKNPFDLPGAYLGANPGLLEGFVRGCAENENYDGVIVSSLPVPAVLEFVKPLQQIQEQTQKAVIIATPANLALPDYARAFISESGLSLIGGLGPTLQAVHAAACWHELQPRPRLSLEAPAASDELHEAMRQAVAAKERVLDHETTWRLLEAYGLSTVDQEIVATTEEATASAARLGYPVVVKAVAEATAHKTELGLVHVGLQSAAQVVSAFEDVTRRLNEIDATTGRVLVQRMIEGGVELYLGVQNSYPGYPPCVVAGVGGIAVEVFNDVATRLAPVDERDADQMLGQLKGSRILGTVRGRPAVDRPAVCDAIAALSNVAVDFAAYVEEIDLNPVIALAEGEGLRVVDALVVLKAATS
jgi:acetate---CoA ligase (ADP-forming)